MVHRAASAQARERPDAIAVVDAVEALSWADLDRRCALLAQLLRETGVTRGDVVGLHLPRSVDAVVAMLAVARAGAAWMPLDPSYPEARLALLASNARVAAVLARPDDIARASRLCARTLTLDGAIQNAPRTAIAPGDEVTPDDAAYVLHTSGSTGEPKGVVVEHRNLQHLANTLSVFDASPNDRVAWFAPAGFDASIWELALSVYCGATLVVTPEALRAPGAALLSWLAEERITHALFTPSLMSLLPGDLPATLRVVVSAGEPLSQRLAARFGPGRRFFNMYGPTETTVYATLWERSGDEVPSLGPLIPGVTARVVDAEGRDVADGEAGELLVGGGGVSRGYLHRPELTASRFVDLDERRYRTGDLVRRRSDGAYDYLGRVDRQVKVRGFRVEPGEVEAALEALPGVARAVVALREDAPGDRRLLAWVVARDAPLDLVALRGELATRLPDPMMPSALVAIPAVPTTDHGKVDYDALPSPASARPALPTPFVAPSTATERALASIFRAVLGVSPVGAHDDLLDLGGDSLRAARILAHVHESFGVVLAPRAALDARTVSSLAALLDAAPRPERARRAARDAALAPLTAPQRRLWWLCHLDPSNVAYNIATEVVLSGEVDADRVARALDAVARRHDLLRAVIEQVDGAPRFRIGDEVPSTLARHDLRALDGAMRGSALDALRKAEAATPFDLTKPLWRVTLARVEGGAHLLWTTHHLILDGWSQTVLLRDLADALDGALSPPPPRFADAVDDERVEASEVAWWREALDGAPSTFEMPFDAPRAAASRRAAETRWTRIPRALAERLRAVARAEGATAFVGLFAAFAALCNLDSGARDVVVATPVADRPSRALAEVLGFFANTVALRVKVREAMTFRALLAVTREATLDALAHGATPFDAVVAAVRPERVDANLPLVQASFAMQETWETHTTGDGLTMRARVIDPAEAPFELQWDFWDDDGGFEAQVTWRADSATAPAIDGMIGRYLSLLEAAVDQPDRALERLLPPWTMPHDAACEEAERALRAAGDEAIVRLRTNDRGCAERVAWTLAPEGVLKRDDRSYGPVVSMASMPRRADGAIDEVRLRRAAIADADTVRRATERAHTADAARLSLDVVTRVAPVDDPPAVHLDDLAPEALGATAQDAPEAHAAMEESAVEARPLAYVSGGPFTLPEGSPRTLVEALQMAAKSDRGISYVGVDGREARQSYATLVEEAARMCAGIGARGLRAGDVAILHAEDLRSHYTAFWGCLFGGVVPVTVGMSPSYEPSHGAAAKLVAVWGALGRPVVITDFAHAEPVKALLGSGARVEVVEALPSSDAPKLHEAGHDDVAFLQLTSGSTGTPRAIQMTHRGILRHARSTAIFNERVDGEVDLNWLPPDHVGPLVACHLADVCNAREQVQVATAWVLADPLRWLDLLDAYGATHTWSPNFGYKLAAERLPPPDDRHWNLSRVRTFMTGGEQVTLDTMQRFVERTAPYGVRPVAMQPSFGMAEACTCVTYQRAFSLPAGFHHVDRASLAGPLRFVAPGSPEAVTFVDLGGPVPGVELRIADEAGNVVPEGTIGRYQIRGLVVTPGYRSDVAANTAAFVGDGWFDTGDLGFLWHGRLALTGRAKDVIIVRGANHPSHELEAAAQVDGVEPGLAAAVAVDDPRGGTEGAAIFVVPDESRASDTKRLLATVRAAVARRTGLAPMYVIPLNREEFPRTSSGKVQRAALRKDLAAGRFRDRIRALDRAEGNERTVPSWFHRASWRPAPLDARAKLHPSTCVIIRGRTNLADLVADALRTLGWTALVVTESEAISTSWRDALRGAGAVLHLATCDGSVANDELANLLALVHAIGEHDSPTRLIVASTRSQRVGSEDRWEPERAAAPALLSAVPHERRSVAVRCVDFDQPAPDRIALEVTHADPNFETAWRGEVRLTSALEAIDLTRGPTRSEPALREGGAWVVTGGLGGIGEIVGAALIARARASLLVVGRRDHETALASDAWQKLTRAASNAGTTVRYESVDVADAEALRASVERFEADGGRVIDGVLHLAGRFDERTLADTSAEGLAGAMRPQVEGARSIEALLAARPEASVVAFASVHSRVGGFTLGPYAAASRWVEAWVARLRASGRAKSWCVEWSLWHDVGMNRASGRTDPARAKGFLAVTATRGVASLLAVLRHDHPTVLVGLDDRNGMIARRLVAAPALTERVIEGRIVGDSPSRVEARDRFGARVSVTLRAVASLDEEPSAAAQEAPVDEVERRVAAIWCAALGRDRVGSRDNFFDLGGHSLLLAQVQHELSRAFSREVQMVELFRRPTVHALAAWLREPAKVEGSVDAAAERGRMQRAALEQQRRARAKRGGG